MDAAWIALMGALGWSAPFAILALLGMLIFKKNIASLVDRMKELRFPGGSAELESPAQQQQIESVPQPTLPEPQPGRQELPPKDPGRAIAGLEAELRQRLEHTAPGSTEVQFQWAVRVAASVMLDRDMEVTYRIIFGSQIAALKEMNVRGFMTVERAEQIYSAAKARFPDMYEALTFESWAEFPIERALVTRPEQPVGPKTKVHITDLGRQFLHFMTAKSLSEFRVG